MTIKYRIHLLTSLLLLLFATNLLAQNAIIEGYAYETNNRGYLNLVKITVTDNSSNTVVNRAATDPEGFFTVQVPLNKSYTITAEKDLFEKKVVTINTQGVDAGAKVFTKLEMTREPGYIFDVTMAQKWDGKSEVDAIQGALVEIYNNTKDQEELVLKNHPNPYFKFTFEKGNHYTVMIRKKGFFTKRMEAYVDVDGCILCFDGLDEVSPSAPGASDNLTAGHQMGTIVANVELVPIKLNEGIKIRNIYYDLAKWDIRPDAAKELDKLIVMLESNPSLVVELGSHTDARGTDWSNNQLSDKRAKSAVKYILDNSNIPATRLSGKGYGETELVNDCKDGVKCSERKHQENRRTELKIVGVLDYDPFDGLSLANIIAQEKEAELIEQLMNQEVVEIKAGEDLPEEIRRQLEGEKAASPVADTPTSTASTTTNTASPSYLPPPPPTRPATDTPAAVINPIPEKDVVNTPPRDQATHEFIFEEETPSPSPSPSTGRIDYEVSTQYITRPPKPLPLGYSGFKIEFFTANAELPLSHNIFARHGNITVEQRKDGRYAYLLGDFPKKDIANGFLADVMLRQYPQARLIKYNNGRRVTK